MDINNMTRKEFEALPQREWNAEIGEFSGLVILPATRADELHDSGFRYMDFVAVRDQEPVCRLAGGSDVVHVDGIGGYGKWDVGGGIPHLIPPSGWSIDCLARSGLLHMWPSSGRMTCGAALSSFEIYAVPRQTKK